MIHSTHKAIEGEIIGLDFTPEDIHIMRLNETEAEFDARIEEYVETEEHEEGLINAIEEERLKRKVNFFPALSSLDRSFVLAPVALILYKSFLILRDMSL